MAVGGVYLSAASTVVDQGVLEAAAAVVDPPVAEAAFAVDSADSEIINWVEMLLSNLRWVLAWTRGTDPVPKLEDYGIYTEEDLERKDADMLIRRTIATLQSDQDDFFEYQARVREVFLRDGRVMVPEDFLGPTDELQKAIDEAWGDGIIPSVGDDDTEPEASDTDCSINQVLPSE